LLSIGGREERFPWRSSSAVGTSATSSKLLDDGVFDVEARRRSHEKIAQDPIVGGNDLLTVEPVASEKPFCQQQRCALVSFSEALSPSNAERDYASGVDRIVDLIDRSKRPLNLVEIVGLIDHSSSSRTARLKAMAIAMVGRLNAREDR
jgi:hypothetical protein